MYINFQSLNKKRKKKLYQKEIKPKYKKKKKQKTKKQKQNYYKNRKKTKAIFRVQFIFVSCEWTNLNQFIQYIL